MITIDREYLGLMMEAGYILLGMQRYNEAREVFDGIIPMATDSDIPLVAKGSVEFCEGHFEEALNCYKAALKLNKESLYARAYMGECYFFMGQQERAITYLKEVKAADPKDPAAEFAGALLDAITKGYTPGGLSGLDEMKDFEKKGNERAKGKRV